MSTLEIAAAVVVGLQLLEAKHHVKEDLRVIQGVSRHVVPYMWSLYRGRASFWYLFENAAKRYPNNVAIAFPRPNGNKPVLEDGVPNYDNTFSMEQYTYQEFYDMILRFSHLLKHEYGVTLEHTIAIDLMNKPLFILLWFSLWNIGALPAFLNYNQRDKPLVHCIKIANVLQVFVDPDCAEAIRDTEAKIHEELPSVRIHYINEAELFKVIRNPSTPRYRAPDATRRAQDKDLSAGALIYTLGTTGLPKAGIMLWRKAFMAGAFFGSIMKVNNKLNVMTAMPLYHLTAAMLGVCPTLSSGGTVTVCQKFLALTFWTQAKLLKATHVQYVGEVCRYLLNAKHHPDMQRHSVQIAYGNGLRRDIWQDFKRRFNVPAIGEFYAATESPIATTNLQHGDFGVGACRKYGTLINSVLNMQQTLVKMDPEDENEIWRNPKTGFCVRADANSPGELLIRIINPKNVEGSFQGYYGNKGATNEKILRDVFKKGDAWFRSGDLLKMDEDGLLYFVDRLGDTFRWKSENVSATEVEEELMGSKAIKQSVVVGVRVPNHEGRAGFAVLEKADGLLEEEALAKIYAHVLQLLPKYAVPQFIKIGPIEMLHNHKVPKNQFKNQKLPKGESGSELIYWLNKDRYEELTEEAWAQIMSGASKL